MKKILTLSIGILLSSVLLFSCGTKKTVDENDVIKVGVTPTPHGVIIDNLKDEFNKEGLKVETVIFNDYVQPNKVLNDGELDANYFQHKPYFDTFVKEHNLDLEILGYVHIEPMGIYSTKYTSLADINEKDEILIPNDPTNGGRALLLLQKAGLITLKEDKLDATIFDIKDNPKKLKITPVDAPTIPKAYSDVAFGVINANFAINANIDPKSAIFIESGDSPYANLVAVKSGKSSEEKFKKFIKVLQSDKAKEIIDKEFQGAVVPATDN